ncbi:MAG TPA: expansin EXLX1 family cellulose-binding protein [Polyangiaceae bacterium]|nr:expansin EXLX1 family cellulose-binding protein [Polyangiaceae bacterium]
MNVNFDRASSTHASRKPSRLLGRRHAGWLSIGSSLSLLGLATAAGVGCGSASEDDDGNDVPGFNGLPGNMPGVAGTGSTLTPGAGGTSSTPSGTPEGMNPNLPVSQPGNGGSSQVGSTQCTPNTASCNGNMLQRCDGAGIPSAPQDCAAMGGTCGMVAGAPGCVAPSCTVGAATCATANTVSTCAEGGMLNVTRCPDGTNCTGAGQCTPVACNPAGMRTSNGTNATVTVYWFAQKPTIDVNCSFGAQRTNDMGQNDRVPAIQDPDLFGAINLAVYDGAAACGACVELTPINGGQPTTITVADSCNPGIDNNTPCQNTAHIDLSRNAFQRLTNNNTGNLGGVSWRYVPCDGVENVQFVLKEPANAYWNEFLVTNHKYPITRAEVLMEDGRWVDAQRQDYNYWRPPEGMDGGDMGTYRVRVTDVNGGLIEEQLELKAGPQGGSGQFGCQ